MANTGLDFEGDTLGSPPAGVTLRKGNASYTMNVVTGKYCEFNNNGQGSTPNGATLDAADGYTGEINILFRFKLGGTAQGGIICAIYGNSAADMLVGYGIVTINNTTWNMCPFLLNGPGVSMGSNVTFTLGTGTFHWCRFGRDSSGNWFGKIWDTVEGDEPGGASLATGAQCSSAAPNTSWTSGFTGMQSSDFHQLPTYDSFYVGSAGSVASSGGGGVVTPQQGVIGTRGLSIATMQSFNR